MYIYKDFVDSGYYELTSRRFFYVSLDQGRCYFFIFQVSEYLNKDDTLLVNTSTEGEEYLRNR